MKKILFLLFVFLLSGCSDYRELNDLAIVSGINIGMDHDIYNVSVQVIDTNDKSVSSNNSNYYVYNYSSKNLHEAFRNIVKFSPKKIYTSQLQVLIIDESLAANRVNDILDFFVRNPDIRSNFYILIGSDDNIFDTSTNNISSSNIFNSINSNNKYLGLSNKVTFIDLLSVYLNDKQELAIPSIKFSSEGNNPLIGDISVFKKNKLVGYLNESESLTYNIIMNNVSNYLVNIDLENNSYITSNIIYSKCHIDVNPKDNVIDLNILGSASISTNNSNYDLENIDDFNKVQYLLNNEINNLISESINSIIDNYNSDIFGFQDLYYKNDYNYYNNYIKNNWYSNYLKNIKFNINSNIKITEKGFLNGGLYE